MTRKGTRRKAYNKSESFFERSNAYLHPNAWGSFNCVNPDGKDPIIFRSAGRFGMNVEVITVVTPLLLNDESFRTEPSPLDKCLKCVQRLNDLATCSNTQ